MVLSQLRAAAGYWIAHGRALARLEDYRALVESFTRSAAQARELGKTELAEELERFAHHYAGMLGVVQSVAAQAKLHAEELMAELESPGAALARRVLSTARAARAAWRGSR